MHDAPGGAACNLPSIPVPPKGRAAGTRAHAPFAKRARAGTRALAAPHKYPRPHRHALASPAEAFVESPAHEAARDERWLSDVVALVRPRQWYKNLLVFAGLVFGFHLFDAPLAARAGAAFGLFCLISGGIYALNDALDAQRDRLHPQKRTRPVAAGRVSRTAALAIGASLVAVGLALAWALDAAFLGVAASYVALQAAYALVLKHHVFLDLFSIALGLLLRAVGGVVIIGVYLSPWLLLCTFFLALFLGLGKRTAELRALGEDAAAHRENLREYTPALLAQATTVITAVLVMSYSLYTFSHPNQAMMATIPFALYGLFRYQYMVAQRDMGGEPEAIFRDAPFVLNFALWGIVTVLVLYGVVALPVA